MAVAVAGFLHFQQFGVFGEGQSATGRFTLFFSSSSNLGMASSVVRDWRPPFRGSGNEFHASQRNT